MCILEATKIWNQIVDDVKSFLEQDSILIEFYQKNILQHKSLGNALSYILSNQLSISTVSAKKIQKIFNDIYIQDSFILNAVVQDLKAILNRDPVVSNYLTPLLYLKGFHALQSYRLSHYLWNVKKTALSIYLQSRISAIFTVDIHPAASIGSGIMLDHATGIVIGEGTIIEDNVSLFHSVTLGGTGKDYSKNRHPIIRKGAIIGAGAKILGNIEVGLGAKIGAGSIVLKNVPKYVTVVGVPAKIINQLDQTKYSSPDVKENGSSLVNTFQYGDGI